MKKLGLALMVLVSLSGCTTTDPYRTKSAENCVYVQTGDCSDQSITVGNHRTENEYLLGFYEYDEQGMLYFPEARERLVKQYRDIADSNAVLLITFFHGWHHNAKGDPEDTDIVQFRRVLSTAAAVHSDKKVLGVYVGWRGRSLPGYLDYLTFWGRKHTAHEVGQLGGVTEALLELESIVTESGNSRSRMVTVGHSFGGAALYSTIGHVLAERYASSREAGTDATIDGFGDLVVLINPAFEASRFTSLFELSQANCESYPANQKPRLIALSSSADWAVGIVFQAGQFFNAIREEHRITKATHCKPDSEGEYQLRQFRADINGIGHYRPFLTHDLTAQLAAADKGSVDAPAIVNLAAWQTGISEGIVSFNRSALTSRGITRPNNPYMNIYTDSSVMSGHNDIWTDQVLDFLNQIIVLAAL